MSGGSYDYLFAKDAGDFVNNEEEVDRMARRLAELGYADDVAAETTALLLEVRAFRIRANGMARRLSGVWKAVEWWDSADTSEDDLRDALLRFRA